MDEGHGISVFYKDEDGKVYDTYSCFRRGVDNMMTACQYIDLLPERRNSVVEIGIGRLTRNGVAYILCMKFYK